MNTSVVTPKTELRISRGELLTSLKERYEFLWHFARKMAVCTRCKCQQTKEGPYRIYVNGYGDFSIYHRCRDCDYPVRYYVDLSQDRDLRRELRTIWLTKIN